jgi:hypothetical protein
MLIILNIFDHSEIKLDKDRPIMKKTIVIGASSKAHRYSNKAVSLLRDYGHEVIAIGNKKGTIKDVTIETEKIKVDDVDTITLYLSAQNQIEFYDYIIGLHPKRIIMNPGTENDDLKGLAIKNNIEVIEHCTLVMLNLNHY